jgi:hypothetical protein
MEPLARVVRKSAGLALTQAYHRKNNAAPFNDGHV